MPAPNCCLRDNFNAEALHIVAFLPLLKVINFKNLCYQFRHKRLVGKIAASRDAFHPRTRQDQRIHDQENRVTRMDATSAQKWMKNPRRHRQIFMTTIAAVICLFFLRMCLHGSKKTDYTAEGAFAQPVTVATAMKGDLPIIMTELGTVVPITNVTVQSRVSGYIMAVNFSEGQHVKSGDELVLIDPRPYEIALQQALGQCSRMRPSLQMRASILAGMKSSSAKNQSPP